MGSELVFTFFLIFTGATALSTLALYTRQPLLVAYIALGALFGPHGFELVTEPELLAEISHIGIIFLLFLLGLDLQPSNLAHLLKKSTIVAIISTVIFAGVGFGISKAFGFNNTDALVIAVAMTFSSTIIGIKLLPTTVLHHKHTGELVVALLLLQDFIAIIVLIVLFGGETGEGDVSLSAETIGWFLFSLPVIVIFAFGCVRWVLLPLLKKFDRFHEYIFLLAIGWCLGIAEFSVRLGLSLEIGAFIAGIAFASSSISQYIANHLKPLRDFFLILFFFSLGARFDFTIWESIVWPSLFLGFSMLALKPIVYSQLLSWLKESKKLAWEVGFRLGQISEFSLLIAYIAYDNHTIGSEASHIIQATAILTFLMSSYIVVFRYPTPIAVSDHLRRD